ncbi:MAG: HAD-IA family hydrolase [Deltaproteobacteria bacterium]|nr:HAD-IA family hydrolase [Deltaproteobacteria bacterium]
MTPPQPARLGALLDRYDGVLLDAYGVLNDARGALPHARELIAALNARGQRFAIVTNDASRSPATLAARFAGMGMAIAPAQIVTSGQLIAPHLRGLGLGADHRCLVLGTDDSRAYVAAADIEVVDLAHRDPIDAIAVCDDAGSPFLAGIEAALSAAIRAMDAGRPIALVLPNPDLVYPKGPGEFGFTAGAMALLIETALLRRHADAPRFAHLGKPQPLPFALAAERLGTRRLLMIGDQLETDIAGARAAGLDAALVAGVSRWTPERTGPAPTWLLDSLAL